MNAAGVFPDGRDADGEGQRGAADGERAVPVGHHHREARGGGVSARARALLVSPAAPPARSARLVPATAHCAGPVMPTPHLGVIRSR